MTIPLPPSRFHQVLGTRTAADALRDFVTAAARPAIGFCYRPVDARWFRLRPDGTATGPESTPLDLTGVFEIRAFTGTHELRWRNESAGAGPAVLVTDHDHGAAPPPYRRLLWGMVVGSTDGWATLSAARIGTLTVPVDGPPPPAGWQVWLWAVEYEAEDEHGNVAVVDERLTGLEARPPGAEERPR